MKDSDWINKRYGTRTDGLVEDALIFLEKIIKNNRKHIASGGTFTVFIPNELKGEVSREDARRAWESMNDSLIRLFFVNSWIKFYENQTGELASYSAQEYIDRIVGI